MKVVRRARAILERIINYDDRGASLQIGNTCDFVLKEAGLTEEVSDKCPDCLKKEDVELAATMETDIAKFDDKTIERLYRHGFEVADYTLYAYNSPELQHIGYQETC